MAGAGKVNPSKAPQAHAFKDKSKAGDIRSSNITAAKGNVRLYLTEILTVLL